MKNAIRFLHFPLAAFVVVGLASCQPTYLLKEDFSADVMDNPPAKDIAGAPTGDLIRYSDILIPRLKVQASTVKAGAKALVLSEAPINQTHEADSYLSFDGLKADVSKTTRFEWTAQHRKSTGTLLIDAYGPQLMWITRLYLRPDGQLIRSVDVTKDVNYEKHEVLCKLDVTQPHTIFITLNHEDPETIKSQGHTYGIGVYNTLEGKPFSRQALRVLFEPNPKYATADAGKMTLTFGYKPESVNADYAYVIERVNMLQP